MFRTALLRSANLAKRSFATAAKDPLVPKAYNTTFKQNFMSDPSTYPLLAIMAIAMSLIVGMSANALGRYKNVKILPEHKHEVIPNWEEAHKNYNSVTESITRRPIAFHADGFKAIRHEGLGVDHEEWVKKNEQGKK